ncbi:hypothetical protein, partial [Bradyrhizobium sp.]|uniref:hypothetical protein n=1 Tax=Bradyrhizobium sp. TaxID=376 RepID=UPI0025C4C01D
NEVMSERIPGAALLMQQHGSPVYLRSFGVQDVARARRGWLPAPKWASFCRSFPDLRGLSGKRSIGPRGAGTYLALPHPTHQKYSVIGSDHHAP